MRIQYRNDEHYRLTTSSEVLLLTEQQAGEAFVKACPCVECRIARWLLQDMVRFMASIEPKGSC